MYSPAHTGLAYLDRYTSRAGGLKTPAHGYYSQLKKIREELLMTNFKFQQPVQAKYWYQNQYGNDIFDLVDSCEFTVFFL